MKDTSSLKLRSLVLFSKRRKEVNQLWLKDELEAIFNTNSSDFFLKLFDSEKLYKNTYSSSVLYVLGVTDEPPLRYPDKLFVSRGKPPALADVDLDCESRYKDQLFEYLAQKYGQDRVAHIITFAQIRARSAVRDTARVLGYDYATGDKLAKALPPLIMGVETPLSSVFDPEKDPEGYARSADVRALYESDPVAREIYDQARNLEGLHRSDGIHAAAVVIADQPLVNLVPLQRKKDGPVTTQYEMHAIEELGLLKMDLLGLKTLDIISECIRLTNTEIDINKIPLSDVNTLLLLRKGQTTGCFQLDSQGMRDLLIRLQPTSFDDIAAVVALYRPGPMGTNMHNEYADRKNHRKPAIPFHPDAEKILERTYQLPIFQEEIMQIAQKFAGYSLAEADILRKVIGKKDTKGMDKERAKFIPRCVETGYTEQLATSLFETIHHFSSYSFNQAHAVSYGLLAYQTAYLKANYTREYMAALCSFAGDLAKTSTYIQEARALDLTIYHPNVNTSDVLFSVREDGIEIGLASIDGVGESESTKIVNERLHNGRFTSLYDFMSRVLPTASTLESLANAGALDEFGYTRLAVASSAKEISSLVRKAVRRASQQASLFETDTMVDLDLPTREYQQSEKLQAEFNSIGVYISGHPLDSYVLNADKTIADLAYEQNEKAQIDCVLTSYTVKKTRAGSKMAILDVMDYTGTLTNITVFGEKFDKYHKVLSSSKGVCLHLKGRFDKFAERITYNLEHAELLALAEARPDETRLCRIYLPIKFVYSDEYVLKLKNLLLKHSGDMQVLLHVSNSSIVKLTNEYKVNPSDDSFKEELKLLFRQYSGR